MRSEFWGVLYVAVQIKLDFPQYRPPFAYSYYSIKNEKVEYCKITREQINDYNTESGVFADNNTVFISSLNCTPINIAYIMEKIAEYNHFSRKLSDNINIKMTGMMSAHSIEVMESKRMIESNQDKISKEFKEERNRHIQLLGLLAAFLAFVSANVTLSVLVSNLFEFVMFSILSLLTITAFAFIIYLLHGDKERTKHWWCGSIIWILLFIATIIAILWVHPDKIKKDTCPQKNEIEVQTNTVINKDINYLNNANNQ